MGNFSEKIRKIVKRKAAFRCCRCQNIGGVEAHHIIPKKDGGFDELDNAAPLCSNCHEMLGDNPSKRKEIKQMRDWWYEQVEKKYDYEKINTKVLEEINNKVDALSNQHEETLTDLKETLKKAVNSSIENMTFSNALGTASEMAYMAELVPLKKASLIKSISIINQSPSSYGNFMFDKVRCPNPSCRTLGKRQNIICGKAEYKCNNCGTEFEA